MLIGLDRTLERLQDLRKENKEIALEKLTKAVERVLGAEELIGSRLAARFFPTQLKRMEREGGKDVVLSVRPDMSEVHSLARKYP